MKVFSVFVLCVCTGSCVAQGAAAAAAVEAATSNAVPNAAATTADAASKITSDAAPSAAAAGAERVLNAPAVDAGYYAQEEYYNPRERITAFFVQSCYDCPGNKMCRRVSYGKSLCYIDKDRVCDPTPDSGCKSRRYWVRWFYDHYSGQCTKFLYGGCGGNKNNFHSFRECERACSSPRPVRRDNFRNDHGYYERYEPLSYYHKG